MPIQVQGPDGQQFEFPDGTDQNVMRSAMQKHYGAPKRQANANGVDPMFANAQAGSLIGTNMTPQEARGRNVRGFTPMLSPQDRADAFAYDRYQERVDRAKLHSGLGAIGDGISGAYHAVTGAVDGIGDIASQGYNALTGNSGRSLSSLVAGAGPSRAQLREQDYRSQMGGSTAAKVGDLAGNVALFAAPASKIAKIGGIGQLAANAGLGGVQGALAPTVEGESRLSNVELGALLGAGGDLAIRAPVYASKVVGSMLAPLTKGGQQRIAARAIRSAATDANSLGRITQSQVPGVQRTLAETSLDPGIAQLQRQFPEEMASVYAANNVKRADAIRQAFHGADDAAISGIESARDAEASRVLGGLKSVVNPAPPPAPVNHFGSLGGTVAAPIAPPSVISLDSVKGLLSGQIDQQVGRPAVQSTLGYVRDLMSKPVQSAEQAYNIRKTIGDLMEGKIGGDLASSKVARSQLIEARDALDAEMGKAFPEWGNYLKNYRAASTKADQARVGQTLLNRAAPVADATTGERTLTPAALSRAANDPDALVRAATGFDKATASGTLTPNQLGLLGALGDDAASMNVVNNLGRAVGSNTKQNLATGNMLNTALGNGKLASLITGLQPVQRLTSPLEKLIYTPLGAPEQIKSTIAEMLANPAQAQAVMSRLDSPTRAAVERWIYQSGAGAALAGHVLTQGASTSP